MKFLGIDYGIKRIGLAISDENRSLAFPKEIILNNRSVFSIRPFHGTPVLSADELC